MWFSAVCTLIDIGTRYHSGQNVVDSRGAALDKARVLDKARWVVVLSKNRGLLPVY